ncbi:condensation domain-containing protein [Pelistega sp. MC2]|uniref:condensation domain-containing protein n=1 Tax=Pelistega sp. MC2 TaxID=1720297 RepID=UPI0008DA0DCC|nr:condensation domain-containing protein [Pelistega sp. MC2]
MNNLTPMQQACWFGRVNQLINADGQETVSSHLYIEFLGRNIDVMKLIQSIKRLYSIHPMMRLRLSQEGEVDFIDEDKIPAVVCDDLQGKPDLANLFIFEKRKSWEHQVLNIWDGEVIKFSITLLDEGQFILHIDADMLALDPSCIPDMLEDLCRLYRGEELEAMPSNIFFDFIYGRTQSHHSGFSSAQKWWGNKVNKIAPCPLEKIGNFEEKRKVKSVRLYKWLTEQEYIVLEKIARSNGFTPSVLTMSLFAYALSEYIGENYRLSIPVFNRRPPREDKDRCIGEFANFTIVNVNLENINCLRNLCQDIAVDLYEKLDYSDYDGVLILRDLSRKTGRIESAPIVFTSGLDIETGNLYSERVKEVLGSLNWTISQSSHVALDAQIVRVENNVLINWDVRVDIIPEYIAKAMFRSFCQYMFSVIQNLEFLDEDIRK